MSGRPPISAMPSVAKDLPAAAGCCEGPAGVGARSDVAEGWLKNNRVWAAQQRLEDPNFFKRLCDQQNPEYLWIGCSDSRVPANQILGMAPGEIFVQRNVGNQAMHTDMNLMSCLEYAIRALKVKTVIVCGHYNCGAVKAALQLPTTTPGLVNCWISDIRECRNQHETELRALPPDQQLGRLCELNVMRQVFHVCTSPIMSAAWADGQEVAVYGSIYNLHDGLIRKLVGPICGDSEYQHKLESFMEAGGIVLGRCPTTQELQVMRISADGTSVEASGTTTPQAGNSSGVMSGSAIGLDCDLVLDANEALNGGPSMLRIDSELQRAINNVTLLDKINRHAAWASSAQ